jgi:hypothetical protein
MVNVATSSIEILKGVEDIVKRTNEQIKFLNSLPADIRHQMNTQVYDDIEYLLRYINALQATLAEVAQNDKPDTFTL